jgi:hypothetical protein
MPVTQDPRRTLFTLKASSHNLDSHSSDHTRWPLEELAAHIASASIVCLSVSGISALTANDGGEADLLTAIGDPTCLKRSSIGCNVTLPDGHEEALDTPPVADPYSFLGDQKIK